MPRKNRGLFGRLADFGKNLVGFFGSPVGETPEPRPIPIPEPPEPKQPPKRSSPPGNPGPATEQGRMMAVFEHMYEIRYGHKGLTEYQDWQELFLPMRPSFTYGDAGDETRRVRAWRDFLRAYYLRSDERDSLPRVKFHEDTGIPRSLMDWDLWKEINGYNNSKRR